jgi:hypothetical protein
MTLSDQPGIVSTTAQVRINGIEYPVGWMMLVV